MAKFKVIHFGYLLYFIYIIINIFSLISHYFSLFFGGSVYYIIMGLSVVLSIMTIRYKRLGKTKFLLLISFMLFYVISLIVFQAFRTSSTTYNIIFGISISNNVLQLTQVLSILLIYVSVTTQYNYRKYITFIGKIIVLSILINSLFSIFVLITYPNASRLIATGNLLTDDVYLAGTSGYSIVYSFVILIPIVIFHIISLKGLNKIVLLVTFCGMLIFLYFSAYTIALLLALLAIVFVLFVKVSRYKKAMTGIMMLVIIGILYYTNNLYEMIIFLSNNIPIYQVQGRLYELAQTLNRDGSGLLQLYRINLYKQSIEVFLNNPLFGTIFHPNYMISEHSTIFDTLGSMGLFGFSAYVLFLLCLYKVLINQITSKVAKSFFVISWATLIILSIFNPILFTPIFIYLLFFTEYALKFGTKSLSTERSTSYI